MAATPAPTDAAEAPEESEEMEPAVTVPQMERIMRSIAVSTNEADEARDAAALPARFTGPALEARQANLDGAGAIGVDRLVREALRMRPDRLVVGECRGPELREMLAALNTGHDGGAGTLHANSLADVPARLEALGALAGMSPDALARQAVSAIGCVIHIERVAGARRVAGLGRLELDQRGSLAIRDVA